MDGADCLEEGVLGWREKIWLQSIEGEVESAEGREPKERVWKGLETVV